MAEPVLLHGDLHHGNILAAEHQPWLALDFHRSLSTHTRGFLDAGFSIGRIVEPPVTEEHLTLCPELDDELRVPNFIIYILRKP
jgi:Aminoglycoside/hydroxyurea antibiotic resistance kinase